MAGTSISCPQTQGVRKPPSEASSAAAISKGLPSLIVRSADQRRSEPEILPVYGVVLTATWQWQRGHSVQ